MTGNSVNNYCIMKINQHITFAAVLVLVILISRPACAQEPALQFKVRADLAPEYRMFIPGHIRLEDIDDFIVSSNEQENQGRKNNQKRSNWSVNVSRLVVGGQKVDPFEDDRFSKWNMLKTLPGDFASAQTYQDRLEIVGKIFEPKVTLDIEF
ncbi:MAG: hypothetical protein ABFD62_08500 [Syntrophaceae bacterium]